MIVAVPTSDAKVFIKTALGTLVLIEMCFQSEFDVLINDLSPFSPPSWLFLTRFHHCFPRCDKSAWRTFCSSPTVCSRPLGTPKQIATTTPAASASTWTSTSTSTAIPPEGTSTTTCWRRWEEVGGMIEGPRLQTGNTEHKNKEVICSFGT